MQRGCSLAKAIGVLLAAALGVVAMSWRAAETHDVREIRLVARGMTFYLDGSGEANPTLRLHAGETVRLVLRNEDRGMTHDFTVRGWNAATPPVAGLRDGSVTVTAPARGTRTGYYCSPHQQTMKGTIIVE
jgi:plastocyanin